MNKTKDLLTRSFHTFWQAFVVVFLAGAFDVFSAFQKDMSTGKAALVALLLAAGAAGLSALKTAYQQSKQA
jgi:hypothetical protein